MGSSIVRVGTAIFGHRAAKAIGGGVNGYRNALSRCILCYSIM